MSTTINDLVVTKRLNDGGPAFPWKYMDRDSTGQEVTREQGEGMSLRDWFAGQILASGVIDSEESGTVADAEAELGLEKGTYTWKKHWPALRAKRAYEAADAMLAARDSNPAES